MAGKDTGFASRGYFTCDPYSRQIRKKTGMAIASQRILPTSKRKRNTISNGFLIFGKSISTLLIFPTNGA
jgi:hypothetical protein